mgnify:CR=1 FL=1
MPSVKGLFGPLRIGNEYRTLPSVIVHRAVNREISHDINHGFRYRALVQEPTYSTQ